MPTLGLTVQIKAIGQLTQYVKYGRIGVNKKTPQYYYEGAVPSCQLILLKSNQH